MKKLDNTQIYFFKENDVPEILTESVIRLREKKKKLKILDVGCGLGAIYYVLFRKGIINESDILIGNDLDIEKLSVCKKINKSVITTNKNVGSADFPYSGFDLIICTQVIEHVQQDYLMLEQLRNKLKVGGVLFISTVAKGKRSVFFYKRKGQYLLDPTHVREYKSAYDFEMLLEKANFEVINKSARLPKYSIADIFLRKLNSIYPLGHNLSTIYFKNLFWKTVSKFEVKVPGFLEVEFVAVKKRC